MAKFAPKNKFQFKARGTSASGSTSAPTTPDTRRDPRLFVPLPADAPTTGAEGETSQERHDRVASLPGAAKDYNREIERAGKAIRQPSFSQARDIVISDHSRMHILLPPSASRATSAGALTNIYGCIVDMSVPTWRRGPPGSDADKDGGVPFATLTLRDIAGSLIIAGHVDGPAHITGVRDSVVVVVARQVRIHECENVDFYLWCGSHPIIEDCKGLRFAPAGDWIVSCYFRHASLFLLSLFFFYSCLMMPTFTCFPFPSLLPEMSVSLLLPFSQGGGWLVLTVTKNGRSRTRRRARPTSGIRLTTSSGSRSTTRPTGPSCPRTNGFPKTSGPTLCRAGPTLASRRSYERWASARMGVGWVHRLEEFMRLEDTSEESVRGIASVVFFPFGAKLNA